MSLTTLFFGQRKTTSYGFLVADVLKTETIDMNAEVTSHPVEFGYEINDHVILKPRAIKATFFISDDHVGISTAPTVSRVSAAYDLLKLQRATRLPFTYVSALEIFPFCIATGISAPRSPNDGDSISFELTIQEVVIVPPFGITFPSTLVSSAQLATVASMVTL